MVSGRFLPHVPLWMSATDRQACMRVHRLAGNIVK